MNDSTLILTINIITILFLCVFQLFMPRLTRRDIYFGIRIPSSNTNANELKNIHSQYIRNVLIVSAIALLSVIIINQFTNLALAFTVLLLVVLVVFCGIYLLAHKKVKTLKHTNKWINTNEDNVIIDTTLSARSSKNLVASPIWFLISVFIIVINVYIMYINYNTLPADIPIHWGISGEADQWVAKTPTSVLILPCVQIVLLVVTFISYKSIYLAKQQLDSADPIESRERNRLFRLKLSRYIVATLMITQILLLVMYWTTLKIICLPSSLLSILSIACVLLIIGLCILLTFKTGQGGSRLKVKSKSGSNAINTTVDKDDDDYWKLGLFYYNPNDPSLFVEKRFGIGMTINFGRPIAIFLLVGIIALVIVTILLPKIL